MSVSVSSYFSNEKHIKTIYEDLRKGPVLGLRPFLATESPLQTTNNSFYFVLKLYFVLEILIFPFCLFGYVEKRLDKKAIVSFNIYGVTGWTANDCKTQLPDISRSKDNQSMTFGRLIHFRPMFLLWINQVVSFH